MIPKKIHYCWFGRGEKPELAIKCIESWKKFCPDYEIVEWNEDNFDINSNQYVKEAYECRKFAFVTDYVRLYVLKKYGGIYMDTDVEVIKPIDTFLNCHAFSGFENNDLIPTGIIGAEKNNEWISCLLEDYNSIHFVDSKGNMDLTPNTDRITATTKKNYNLKLESSYQEIGGNIVTLYPYDYFCPKSHITNEINLTDNTYTIHHFAASWLSESEKIRKAIKNKYIKKYGKRGILIGNIVFTILHPIMMIKKIVKKERF